MESLERNLKESLNLPPSAVAWLMSLWHVAQWFDDVADGDLYPRESLDKALWDALVAMPSNAFFQANSAVLLPVMGTQILKWKASDTVEKDGGADAKSYGWRAGYYDVVLVVFMLCHGSEAAMRFAEKPLSLYGEELNSYLKEFENA